MKTLKKSNTSSTTKTTRRSETTKPSNKRKSTKSATTVDSINSGINVINLAIKKGLSVSDASKKSGFGRNYVSGIKERLENNYKNKNISRELYRSFTGLVKEYNKASR